VCAPRTISQSQLFEDADEVIRSRKSKKDRQCHGQDKKGTKEQIMINTQKNYRLSHTNPFICKTRIISFIDGGDGGVARMLPNHQQMKPQSYK
jgi:hypothetical protein